ncbi:MAG: FmdB family zinc ribbon protein [Actinomycetota bacterium]|nr:FmdB family zinc ribbon protein [Actinomycetota bacterium]MED5552993.1 FmdB family zinc ribbon protein [Actinomycetota bacterium]MEE3140317.1 FmdB family zinc ribbon protein [Actinomycetota bacterium]
MYSYHCHTCDETFDRRRPMAQSADPAICPAGHLGAKRRLSTFASVGAATSAAPSGDVSSWTGRDSCCGGGCHSH